MLQSRAAVNINWGICFYYKVRHKVLQSSAVFIINWGNYLKLLKHTFQGIPVARRQLKETGEGNRFC